MHSRTHQRDRMLSSVRDAGKSSFGRSSLLPTFDSASCEIRAFRYESLGFCLPQCPGRVGSASTNARFRSFSEACRFCRCLDRERLVDGQLGGYRSLPVSGPSRRSQACPRVELGRSSFHGSSIKLKYVVDGDEAKLIRTAESKYLDNWDGKPRLIFKRSGNGPSLRPVIPTATCTCCSTLHNKTARRCRCLSTTRTPTANTPTKTHREGHAAPLIRRVGP
jgi:hypothetical protein